jgi:glycyl-tRNA synthetase
MPTMQAVLMRLQDYWASQGCLLAQPFNTEVGAGTLNPATFLRVLGPEPWRVAYVEPSVRPDDSRYGENPNRLQVHTQYQVILKPPPDNPQELYLGSLHALGVDTTRHDVRFVEDNWESPAIGAWGLGWEVWLDGLEITQFTYFQQAGGRSLEPPAVELTYGLERIVMALQRVTHFRDIVFTDGVSFGELFGQGEYEMSRYYLDEADIETQRRLFSLYEQEAERLIAGRLPIPAYTYVLKCSHTFNVLDARRAIGASERAGAFARMRKLAHEVAGLWLDRREELNFPLGVVAEPVDPELAELDGLAGDPAAFVLEIGCEELPPDDVRAGVEQLRARMPALLGELHLSHGDVRVLGTPRRLAVIVEELAGRQPDRRRVIRGPQESVAFDSSGQPTKAALGFARSHGVDVTDLELRAEGRANHVVATVQESGRAAEEVLAESLPGMLGELSFAKSMRWTSRPVTFSRPVRWLLALRGSKVVPFAFAGVASGRMTHGLGGTAPASAEVPAAAEYLDTLARLGISADMDQRRATIQQTASRLAREAGGRIPEAATGDLLDEVTNLVEQPTPILGRFDSGYLALPAEVLTTVMAKHQRYLPVEDGDQALLPYFVAVANGQVDRDLVRGGNEAVLTARFADAEFFWQKDTAQPLEKLRAGLSRLIFQERLGSMLDRSKRIEPLVLVLAEWLGLPDGERKALDRAAYLAKADLTTEMVTEFPSLAGVMGGEYARRSGEDPAVAEAITEHVFPRFPGDRLPASAIGIVLGLADRLDSLVGLFAVGITARGSSDPYGLRRQATGLLQILIERAVNLDLRQAIAAAAKVQAVEVSAQTEATVLDFVLRRLEQMLVDQGHRRDRIIPVLNARGATPALATASLRELERLADTQRFGEVIEAYLRVARIVDKYPARAPLQPQRLEAPAELALWQALQQARHLVRPDMSIETFMDAFAPLHDPIQAFFEQVLVITEDLGVRANRLALLREVAALADGILDLRSVQ